ncbi:TPA: hypothetical protein RQL23_003967 [Vibrio vulnificus]|nr:hypothetical protein [Vibrio vulnificus]
MQLTIEYMGVVYSGYTYEEAVSAGIPEAIVKQALLSSKKQITLEIRHRAYTEESDRLYMEWQYDQTPESEKAWRDKVAEIKARYPLPEDAA